ncbi:hypothetical protein JCM21900_002698 [Sporobolomyces salmonicolor]
MLKPLTLPGTFSRSKGGYHALDKPHGDHKVSAGGVRETEIELGDLGERCVLRGGGVHPGGHPHLLRRPSPSSKRSRSTPSPSPSHSEGVAISLSQLTSQLAADSTSHKNGIAALGAQVGNDEARRGHRESLKVALGRAVESADAWDRSSAALHLTRCLRVRLATVSSPRGRPGRRRPRRRRRLLDLVRVPTSPTSPLEPTAHDGTDALSALHEANTRRSELRAIEGTLVELAAPPQQTAELVVEQDGKFGALEATGAALERDLEAGVPQVTAAKIRAAAARPQEEALCCLGTKTKTATSGSAKATQSETATGMATTGAKPAATGFECGGGKVGSAGEGGWTVYAGVASLS